MKTREDIELDIEAIRNDRKFTREIVDLLYAIDPDFYKQLLHLMDEVAATNKSLISEHSTYCMKLLLAEYYPLDDGDKYNCRTALGAIKEKAIVDIIIKIENELERRGNK